MTLEQYMLNEMLYIGNEIPESLYNDPRDKFMILGTPNDMLKAVCNIDYSKIEQEFQEWVDNSMWQGEDEYTKNIAIGNVTQWWINKIKELNKINYE